MLIFGFNKYTLWLIKVRCVLRVVVCVSKIVKCYVMRLCVDVDVDVVVIIVIVTVTIVVVVAVAIVVVGYRSWRIRRKGKRMVVGWRLGFILVVGSQVAFWLCMLNMLWSGLGGASIK